MVVAAEQLAKTVRSSLPRGRAWAEVRPFSARTSSGGGWTPAPCAKQCKRTACYWQSLVTVLARASLVCLSLSTRRSARECVSSLEGAPCERVQNEGEKAGAGPAGGIPQQAGHRRPVGVCTPPTY